MRLTQDIIRKLIKEEVQKRMSSTELTEKAEALLSQLTSLDKNDAIKVVGMLRSQVAKLPTSRDAEADSFAQSPTNRGDEMTEKLGKDATAGDYVEDFEKSDAKQFKGKSKKKKQQMAIAAYLDAQEKK